MQVQDNNLSDEAPELPDQPLPNACCHHCRASKNRQRKKPLNFVNCSTCRNVFCYVCVENQLHEDAFAIERDGNWSCPRCQKTCCCNFSCCEKPHKHCYTYARSLKRAARAQAALERDMLDASATDEVEAMDARYRALLPSRPAAQMQRSSPQSKPCSNWKDTVCHKFTKLITSPSMPNSEPVFGTQSLHRASQIEKAEELCSVWKAAAAKGLFTFPSLSPSASESESSQDSFHLGMGSQPSDGSGTTLSPWRLRGQSAYSQSSDDTADIKTDLPQQTPYMDVFPGPPSEVAQPAPAAPTPFRASQSASRTTVVHQSISNYSEPSCTDPWARLPLAPQPHQDTPQLITKQGPTTVAPGVYEPSSHVRTVFSPGHA